MLLLLKSATQQAPNSIELPGPKNNLLLNADLFVFVLYCLVIP